MINLLRGGLLGLLAIILIAGSVHAGGLYLYEVGTPDVGLAAAGYTARAQDAATVFTNPAGMTRMQRPSLLAGAQPMYLHVDFSADGSTTATGDSGDSNGWMPAGGLFYVYPVNDQVALGFAVAGHFGLSVDYQDDWVGRYYVQDTMMQAMAIQPAIAVRINDELSVGAGVAALYGMFENTVAVNNRRLLDPNAPDGQIKLEDEDWSVQYNLGVLYEPAKGTRLGLTYLSEADLEFSDRAEVRGVTRPILGSLLDGSRRIDLGVTLPQALMFSIYHEVSDNLALMANVGWQDWSEFGKVDVSLSSEDINASVTTDLDYKDTWHAAVGAQYRVSEPWRLTCGVAYDSEMMDEDQITPSLPTGEAWRLALGSRYDWSKDLSLGAAYELVWSGDLDMVVERGPLAGRVSGTYESMAIHVLAFNAEWRF